MTLQEYQLFSLSAINAVRPLLYVARTPGDVKREAISWGLIIDSVEQIPFTPQNLGSCYESVARWAEGRKRNGNLGEVRFCGHGSY